MGCPILGCAGHASRAACRRAAPASPCRRPGRSRPCPSSGTRRSRGGPCRRTAASGRPTTSASTSSGIGADDGLTVVTSNSSTCFRYVKPWSDRLAVAVGDRHLVLLLRHPLDQRRDLVLQPLDAAQPAGSLRSCPGTGSRGPGSGRRPRTSASASPGSAASAPCTAPASSSIFLSRSGSKTSKRSLPFEYVRYSSSRSRT